MDFARLAATATILGLSAVGVGSLYAPVLMWSYHRRDPNRPKLWLPLTLARSLTVITISLALLCGIGVVREMIGPEPLRALPWLTGLVDLLRFGIGLGVLYLIVSVIRNARTQ